MRRPPNSTLFPYTPLYRSPRPPRAAGRAHLSRAPPPPAPPRRRPAVPPAPPVRQRPAPAPARRAPGRRPRSEEHTSELQSRQYLVCRLLLEKKNKSQTSDSHRCRLAPTRPPSHSSQEASPITDNINSDQSTAMTCLIARLVPFR